MYSRQAEEERLVSIDVSCSDETVSEVTAPRQVKNLTKQVLKDTPSRRTPPAATDASEKEEEQQKFENESPENGEAADVSIPLQTATYYDEVIEFQIPHSFFDLHPRTAASKLGAMAAALLLAEVLQ